MTTIAVILFWVSALAIAYVLVGYPLCMAVLARRVSETGELPEAWPAVTLIIPAHNEEHVLQAKLENVQSIDYPRDKLRVIVGSDGSVDKTNAIAHRFIDAGIELFAFEARRGKASVLNDCVEAAKTEFVCLCDANVMFHPDALKKLVHACSESKIGAATGMVRLRSEDSNFGEGESSYYGWERRIQTAESQIGSLMGVDGGMYVIRRALFSKLPADTILDDFVISMRVLQRDFRIRYVPGAVADENGTPIATQEWRRRVRVSAGAVQSVLRGEFPPPRRPIIFWQYLSHKLLRWMLPILLVCVLVCNLFLVSDHFAYWLPLIVQIVGYGIAAIATRLQWLRQTKIGGTLFYFVMSNAAMLVGTAKGLLNMQPVMWVQADRATNPTAEETAST